MERLANLFIAKNVMSLFAILSAAAFALPFPFLPRQLTLISAVTIGIPAFLLALGPNKRRYIPGFLKRVLRFAIPAGIIAGSVITLSDLWARQTYGFSGAARCVGATTASHPVDVACWQPGSGATVALLTTFFWILVVLARPILWWNIAVIISMFVLAGLAFLTPVAAGFFNFNLPSGLLLQSLLVGVIGACAVEVVYRIGNRRTAGIPPELDQTRREPATVNS